MVAVLKSEQEPVRSKGHHLNAFDTLRGEVVLGHGGFGTFRGKTTLERWIVRAWAPFSNSLMLSMGQKANRNFYNGPLTSENSGF